MAWRRAENATRWSVTLAVLATSAILSVRVATRADQDGPPRRSYGPHWSDSGCRVCHVGEGADRVIPEPAAAEALCLRCHDGRMAPREVHPVGRSFDSDQIVKPEDWPAPDDRLGCLTCHDVVQACKDPERPEENPMFLRDYDPRRPLAFCGTCHVAAAETQGGYSPHVMIDVQDRVIPESCGLCHTNPQTLMDRTERMGKPGLRGDEIALCANCHRRHKDWFDPGHIGYVMATPSPTTDRPAEVDDEAAQRPQTATRPAARTPARLPLGPGERIVCSTCHNPHQAGVFPAGSALDAGSLKPQDQTKRLPLRGLGKEVCHACHTY